MPIYSILLAIHVVAGFAALLSALVAAVTKARNSPHRWHLLSGRIFYAGMWIIFLTAIPMAILKPNLFLFLIAFFSIYMAVTGWRFARNRKGPEAADRWIAGVMFVTAAAMMVKGIVMLSEGESRGLVMCVFSVVGIILSSSDYRIIRKGGLKGKERVAGHVSRMMGGTVATLTAFVVTNFKFDPMVVLWLGPGAVIAPFALWWTYRVKSGKARYSMK